MKNGTNLLIALFLIFGITQSFSQSQFATKEEVINYLEGTWNIDVVTGGFAGQTIYLPSPGYYDSTIHTVVFEHSGIDSTPILCRSFINDTLYQETYSRIQENPSQIILPRWQLFDLPWNLEINVDFMESIGFYGFSQDTMVLSGNDGADRYEFGLTRLNTSAINNLSNEVIQIYPNPFRDVVNIEVSDKLQESNILIFNSDGRLVHSDFIDKNEKEIKVNLSKLPMGMYFIQFQSRHNLLDKCSSKLIKME